MWVYPHQKYCDDNVRFRGARVVQEKSVRRSNFPAFVHLIYNRLSNPSYRKQGVGGSKELLDYLLLFLDLWQSLCVSETHNFSPTICLGYWAQNQSSIKPTVLALLSTLSTKRTSGHCGKSDYGDALYTEVTCEYLLNKVI